MKTTIPMPQRIAQLPRDRRGLPVPFVVLRDNEGKPHFTINDHRMVDLAVAEERCHICGERLGAFKCFVGGPGSAFHAGGMYNDGPLHRECATYALQVCPYLALAGSFTKRIDARTLKPENAPKGLVALVDVTMHPDQPVVFVLGVTKHYQWGQRRFVPERPWRDVEYWRGGERVTAAEAWDLVGQDPKLPCPRDALVHWPAADRPALPVSR